MKTALRLQGVPAGFVRRPLLELSTEQVDRVRTTLEGLGIANRAVVVSMRYDAVVIGGGLLGGALTWMLAREGASVLLLEKDQLNQHASGQNAAACTSSSSIGWSRTGGSRRAPPRSHAPASGRAEAWTAAWEMSWANRSVSCSAAASCSPRRRSRSRCSNARSVSSRSGGWMSPSSTVMRRGASRLPVGVGARGRLLSDRGQGRDAHRGTRSGAGVP